MTSSVLSFGAVGDGTTDDTAACQGAIDAAVTGEVVLFPSGKTYLVDELDFDGKAITVEAYGAEITCNGTAAFVKTDHGNLLTILGGQFTGSGQGVRYDAAATTPVHQLDLAVRDAEFRNTGYGIFLDGVREALFTACRFVETEGVYRIRSTNHDFVDCVWESCAYAINDDGDGSGYSAGLKLFGGTIIGCETGIFSKLTDFVGLYGVMCDYNDAPVRFEGVDGAEIIGGYYNGRAAAPAIFVGKNGETISQGIVISPNVVRQSHASAETVCIELDTVWMCRVSGLKVDLFRKYGLLYKNCSELTVRDVTFIGVDGVADACIAEDGATYAASNRILNNNFLYPVGAAALSVDGATNIAGNSGFVTSNFGHAVITTGNMQVGIAHGCHYLPNRQDVRLTATSAESALEGLYINDINATTLYVDLAASASADAHFTWSIEKRGKLI